MKKGKLIVIEGATDGVGKTTQFNLLKEHLEREGEEVVTHHFPTYHSPEGHLVELYLQGKFGPVKSLSPYFINSLYAIDRAIVWKTKLEKAYLEGKIILLDRYTTSSLMYQSSVIQDEQEKQAFIHYASDYEYEKLEIGKPDLVFFLHAPFELVTELRKQRKENDGIQKDIHEKDQEFLYQVYLNSTTLAEVLHFEKIECSENGVMRSASDIHEEIYQKVKSIK